MLHDLLLSQLAARRGATEARYSSPHRRFESLYMKSLKDMRARAAKP